jgi:signal peptidase I
MSEPTQSQATSLPQNNEAPDRTSDDKKPPKRVEKTKESAAELAKTVFFAFLVAMTLRTFIYSPFNIPSESMMPTLLTGDYLFVAKYPYGYSEHSFPFSAAPAMNGRIFERQPKPGDVVVFKTPSDNRTDYIKRLIGMPGDIVQVREGMLYINGVAVKRERMSDLVLDQAPYSGCKPWFEQRGQDGVVRCHFPRFRETLTNGISYETLDTIDGGPGDNTQAFVVPQGHYFVMGDNRDNSQDSRFPVLAGGVGFVPAENLVGRADVLFFSTDGSANLLLPWTWFSAARWQRLFETL